VAIVLVRASTKTTHTQAPLQPARMQKSFLPIYIFGRAAIAKQGGGADAGENLRKKCVGHAILGRLVGVSQRSS